jgi:uncharacterized repeat protein (TIGR01451 family)
MHAIARPAKRIGLAAWAMTLSLMLAGPVSGTESGPTPVDPAPFAQVFNDNADGAMSILLVRPDGQVVKKATGDDHLVTQTNPYSVDMAVVETPDGGFAYAWGNGGAIEYVLLDKAGNVVRPVTQLAAPDCDYVTVLDAHECSAQPSLAVTPDGHIGVAWWTYGGFLRYQYTRVSFAILDHGGSVIYGVVNLHSGSTGLGCPGASNVSKPRLAATEDSHFVMAWEKGITSAGLCTVQDIYWSRADSNGAGVTAPAKLTNGGAGQNYVSPTLAAMPANRVLAAYREEPAGNLIYTVVDSAGGIIKGQTLVASAGAGLVGTQLSNGQAVLAWIDDKSIKFAGLDADFNIINGPTTVPGDPNAPPTDEYYDWGTAAGLAATFDADSHAILTWVEGSTNLYQALVSGAGTVVLTPTIVYSSTAGTPNLFTSSFGQGNTTYNFVPAAGVDTSVAVDPEFAKVAPGDSKVFDVRVTNYGLTLASGIELTATLDSGLTYISDSSGITPTVAGNMVTWALPSLAYADNEVFTLTVGTSPSATLGLHYNIAFSLTSAQAEANPADNAALVFVFAPHQALLPLLQLDYP